MMRNTSNSKYYGSIKISLIYLLISFIYIIFSDHIILLLLGKSFSIEAIATIETFKEMFYVFITSAILFVLIQREIKGRRIYIRELEMQKQELLDLTAENDKVKTVLQERNFYIETILKYIPIGIAVNKIDDGDAIFVNKNFTSIYGWLEKDLVNLDSFFRNVYPDDKYSAMTKKKILEDIESGDPKRMRWEGIEISASSGEKKIINAQNIPVYEQNLMISTVQDVTEQKKAENKIRESENKFRAIFENSLTAILIADDQGDYLSVNDAAVKMFGYSKEEFSTMNVRNLTSAPGNTEQKYVEYVKKGYEKGELDFLKRTGESRTGLYHAIRVSENFNLSFIMDITELKNQELELKRSELLLNETGRLSKVGGWDLDLKTMTTYFSKETYRIHEIPEGTPINVEDGINFYAPEAREIIRQAVNQAIEKHTSYDIEVPFITAKDKRIWVRTLGQVQVMDGKAVRLYGAMQDITVYKEAALKLQESEEKYKLLAENTNDLITLNDRDLIYLYVSPSVKILRGYEPDELIGKSLIENLHPDDIALVNSASFMKKLESGLSTLVIYRFRLKDGEYGWFESNFQPILDHKNELIKIVKVSRDITERIEREQAIEDYQKSLKNLTIEISLIEEKQRKEIAENIHDHLSQLLVISKMKLSDLQNEITTPNARTELKTAIQYIGEALENTRKITYDLSPPVLYLQGLIETMYWLAEKTEKEHHIKTTFSTELKELKLPESDLILIFRMIQEIVNNSIKHAKASTINIAMSSIKKELEIVISDNGQGFDTEELFNEKTRDGGFGLFTVKERVQNLKGSMSIHSERNKGTTVRIVVPLD